MLPQQEIFGATSQRFRNHRVTSNAGQRRCRYSRRGLSKLLAVRQAAVTWQAQFKMMAQISLLASVSTLSATFLTHSP
jgi:hypothetical protein